MSRETAEIFDFSEYLHEKRGVVLEPEYNEDGFMHFHLHEFACRCGCDGNEIDPGFVKVLDGLRHECGFPFRVSSGYRCPDYNADISSSGFDGPHTTGLAADIRLYGDRAFMVLALAAEAGLTGIGVSQRGDLWQRFVHLDALPRADGRPWVWSY